MEPTGFGRLTPLQEVSLYPAEVLGKGEAVSYPLTNLQTPIYNSEFKQMNKERDKGNLSSSCFFVGFLSIIISFIYILYFY